MEYRNSGAATHLSKGFVTGVDSNVGVELKGSTVLSASDSAASGLTVRAKGTGTLMLGDSSNVVNVAGSTIQFKLIGGISTTTIPNMPGASQAVSTFAAAGATTGDLLLSVDARGTLSTQVAMGGYTVTSAAKVTVTWINCHASSITPETTGVTMRWLYLDRT